MKLLALVSRTVSVTHPGSMKSFFTRRRIFRFCIPLAGCFLFPIAMSRAAESGTAQSKATSVLVSEVQDLLAAGSFTEASGYLREILIRIKSLTDAESAEARASCLYQLGVCQLKSADYSGAADSFKKFIADYPLDGQVPMARFMVLEAYARQNDRAQMTAWLNELKTGGAFAGLMKFFGDEKNAEFRRNAVLTLVTDYAEQSDLDNLRTFLPLCDESVITDTGFNMALMSGGDQAFDKGKYARALALYRMVRLKDEVLPVYHKQVAALETAAAEPLPWVPLKERDRQQEDRQADFDRLEGLKQTILFFEETGYDQDLMVRMAQCYDAMQRYRLSVAAYSYVYNKFPEHRLAEQCRASAFQSLTALDDQDAALAAGLDYLARYPQGRFEDEVTVSLMQLHLTRGEIAAAVELGRHALDVLPNRRLADQICYVLGIALLQQQSWTPAMDLFSQVKEKWPQSTYVQDADYWGCMCYLFEGRFDEAITAFKGYLKNTAYVSARFTADVTYRLGVAQYGAEDFAAAEGTFKEFLVLYPDSPLVSEAYSMLGDLRGADGELDLAQTLYQKAVATAVDVEQDSYAVFQSARTYELQQRYAETVDLMKAYMARRGAQTHLAEAGLWIGKACKARGDRRQALEIYLKTLADFGNNPALDGVDQVMMQLLDDLKDGQGSDDLSFAITCLTEERERARQKKEHALSLRLTALLARLTGGVDHDRYTAELLDEKELKYFSPLPLIVLAETYAARGDITGVDRIAEDFKTRFSGSEELIDLLNIEASACLAAQQYERTIALTEEVFKRFDGNPRAVYSRKLQADAFRLSRDWPKAVEMYQKIFSVRAERGALAPETLYWIGVCKREQGDAEKAFAFFQRVYVLYKSHPEWAAKAYEASAECLQKLGRNGEVIQTLKEMVADPSIQNTPEGLRAAEALRRANEG
jgi:TolA-binding protein